jgi:hypothetical protein
LDRPEYAAMLRAVTASTWENMPPMISIARWQAKKTQTKMKGKL